MPRRRYEPPVETRDKKGRARGYAELGTDGKVPAAQLPSGGGGGAPTDAQYVVAAAHAGLSAERVTTDTASVTWNTGTAGQVKANVVFGTSAGVAAEGNHTHAASAIASGTIDIARLPTGTTGTTVALGDAPAAAVTTHVGLADPHTQYALESTIGAASGIASLDGSTKVPIAQIPTGTTGSTVPFGNDARFTDARTPTAHATSHQPGGSDAMAVDAVAATGSLRTLGTGAQQAAAGNDSRLSDARTPTAHATSHKSGGSDAIKLDELAAPTDITTLNASTSAHGLLPKLPGGTTTFLRADGSFAAPTAALALTTVEVSLGAAPSSQRGGKFQITGLAGLTPGKPVLIQQATGPYTGKGTRADEAEMDAIHVSAVVLDATTINAYWRSATRVRGNVKFNYLVSA